MVDEARKAIQNRRQELTKRERIRTWYRAMSEERRKVLRSFGIDPFSDGVMTRRFFGEVTTKK